MLVVADTSALIALAACEGLPLLEVLFETVCVPPAVFAECTVEGKPFARSLHEFLRDRMVKIDLGAFVIAAAGLGAGELEAMALYKRLQADRLLLDDGRARRIARFNGIEVVGSLGLLLLAKRRGMVPAVEPRLLAIRASGIHLSDALVEEALRLAGER